MPPSVSPADVSPPRRAEPQPAQRTDGYAALESYAAIGDGRTVALISTDGRIDWFPVPDLDSPPMFAALLDGERGGQLTMAPADGGTSSRVYLDGSNVLETTWTTATGTVIVTDSLNSGVAGRLPWTELARRVVGISGRVRMRWSVRPGAQLGVAAPWIERLPSGPVLRVGDVAAAVRGFEHHPQVDDAQVHGGFTTSPGSRHLVAVVGTEGEPLNLADPVHIDERVDSSIAAWQAWSASLDYAGSWRSDVLRHALILKLLIYSPTGAIAAAATTSLPESRAGGKNWDYRYAWVRDTSYTIRALVRIGAREEIHAAVAWLLKSLHRHGPHVFTHLSGDPPANRATAPAPGWHGIGPVINGNGASEQLQLGMFGDIFDVVRCYVDAGHVLDPATGKLLTELADLCCDQWRRRDAGIWELEEVQHYTSSKVSCWQALTCAIHLAELGQIPGRTQRWQTERAAIREFIQTHCWNDDLGSYTRYPETIELDASVLLSGDFDDGPQMSATIDVLRANLGVGPLLYRYTGMEREEGAFVACSFWLVSALARVGRVDEAREVMQQLLPLANDVGLFAEMLDPAGGESDVERPPFLGNLPQGLSHLSMINAAAAIDDATNDEATPGDAARNGSAEAAAS
ncbi:MAG: glycoside hydrolase family 15 protein [Nakamurella sp.]